MRSLTALAAVVSVWVLCSCGGGNGRSSASEARTVALAYLRAASRNDGDGLCAHLSNAAQSEVEIGLTCVQALAHGLAGFDGPRERFVMSTFKLSVHGSSAQVSVTFAGARSGVFRFPMTRQNGVWFVTNALTWR